MWICTRCQTANKDGYNQCVQCSAPRNARRFGAGTPVAAPSVQAAQTERRLQPTETAPQAPSPRRQPGPETTTEAPRRRANLAIIVGILLAVLLPALAIALAITQKETLLPLIAGLFIQGGAAASPLPGTIVYIIGVVITALLVMAPGLALWALGRLAQSLRRR